ILCERGPCLKSVKEGSHEVSIRRDGYKPYTRRITVGAKTETSIKVGLAKEPSRTDAIVAYVLAGAFAGGGAYFGLRANSIADELKKDIAAGNPPVDSGDPRLGWGFSLNNGKFNSVMADSLFAIGGITAITAIYYTFRDKGAPSTALVDVRALALTPSVGPSYAGLNMEVRW
ncbi:MAG TPA: PEGA domain-containing protein, partial [Kofleriaceae bacterium]|nr:PEGA domain-containing protein [Kofleriaceae bacterium]